VPDVAFEPDQPPEAVQLVAFVEDHVRVEVPLLATLVGLADNVTVGAGVLEPPPEELDDSEEPNVSLAVPEDDPLPPQSARASAAATMKA
jgi:hypothetical protein